MTPAKQKERNKVNAALFKTVGGRQVCFGAKSRQTRPAFLRGFAELAPVSRGGYLHNGQWRPNLRAYA